MRSLMLLGVCFLLVSLTACGYNTPVSGGFTPFVEVITPSPSARPSSSPATPTLAGPATTNQTTTGSATGTTAAPTKSPALLLNPDGTYTVKAGDTLLGLSIRLGVELNELIALNKIDAPDKLQIGQILKVPPQKGQTATRTP